MIQKAVFVYIFLLGIFLSLFIPPLQKPDAHAHFMRTIMVANGNFYCAKKSGNSTLVEKQFVLLLKDKQLNSLPYHKDRQIPAGLMIQNMRKQSDYSKVSVNVDGFCLFPPYAYVPHAVVLNVLRLFKTNAFIEYLITRLVVFIFCFVWLIYLYKKTLKPYSYFLLFTASLPMTIHQLSAISYDPVHIMTGFTLFYLVLSGQKTPRRLNLLLCSLLFALSKSGFEVLLLFYFLLPRARSDKTKIAYIKSSFLYFITLILFIFLFQYPVYSRFSHYIYPAGVNPIKQLYFILYNPIRLITVLVHTTFVQKQFYLLGLIGIFGWLDYGLNIFIYAIYFLGGIFLMYKLNLKNRQLLSTNKIFFILLILFIQYSEILMLFYLAWMPVGASTIDGVQGRYFITLVPFIFIFFVSAKYNHTLQKLIFIILISVMFLSIISTVYHRYFSFLENSLIRKNPIRTIESQLNIPSPYCNGRYPFV